MKASTEQTLVERLRMRAQIRRSISTRKSVQKGEPDRLAELLEEAADEIECLVCRVNHLSQEIEYLNE